MRSLPRPVVRKRPAWSCSRVRPTSRRRRSMSSIAGRTPSRSRDRFALRGWLDTMSPLSFPCTMPSAAPRTALPSVRRRQILDAAKRRFGRIGFHSTRIGDIADEAGVSVGLIYKYFEGKEALIEAIVQDDIELQLERLSAALSAGGRSLDEAIERGMEAL